MPTRTTHTTHSVTTNMGRSASRLGLLLLGAVLLSACTTLPLTTANDQGLPGHHAQPAAPGVHHHAPPHASRGLRSGNPPGHLAEAPLQAIAAAPENHTPSAVATLTPPADLWERMRQGFAMPELDTDLVRQHEQWHANRPQNLERIVERGSKYLFHIVEEVERRGLPQELALVPFIESAFNPQAVSPVQAAGLWQFMPATGRAFDLTQNAFRDDRRDVLASTRAALDYLERLYAMFGDWHLALAAYNWGNGNVSRAIQRNRAAGLDTGYLGLRMPEETRNYVPKLMAIRNIIADPNRLNVRLPTVGNHPFFGVVAIDRDMDVALIADLADVSLADFRQLNPAHYKPVVMAAGTPSILLPWDNAALFEERLREHSGPTASWTAWRAPRNMTAAEVAKQHDLTETQLRQVNRIPPRMMVRAGSTLLVPRQGQLDADVPEHIADQGRMLLVPERSGGSGGTGPSQRVTVRAGDTLSGIARRHGVSVANLQRWNQLRPKQTLRVGQVLSLQGGTSTRNRSSNARSTTASSKIAASSR